MILDTKGTSRAVWPLEGQFVKKCTNTCKHFALYFFLFLAVFLSSPFFLFSCFSLFLFGPMYLIKCGYLEFGGHVFFFER